MNAYNSSENHSIIIIYASKESLIPLLYYDTSFARVYLVYDVFIKDILPLPPTEKREFFCTRGTKLQTPCSWGLEIEYDHVIGIKLFLINHTIN